MLVWGSVGFRVQDLGFRVYSPPSVDRMWGICGSYYNIPKAIFYLLKGHRGVGFKVWDTGFYGVRFGVQLGMQEKGWRFRVDCPAPRKELYRDNLAVEGPVQDQDWAFRRVTEGAPEGEYTLSHVEAKKLSVLWP